MKGRRDELNCGLGRWRVGGGGERKTGEVDLR